MKRLVKVAWEEWTGSIRNIDHPSVLITEAGMIPIKGAHRTPYVWEMPGGKVDRQAQADYYEATFYALEPVSEGMYWWAVTLGESEAGTIDYSPLHGPAEDVIEAVFSR